ncbi:hypothetical protein [Spirosoma sordidisoli]|uniref:Glycoside hydrolase family 2 domain-containing protein n=1 Tax=Spirosoma sordidisoli TaxID=2502893 RepID=A0A4Q2UE82_9BACT|nr:hypothetical protein [Spirosoma sordidisoli]RYC67176.1 hypothetical protein EQG79_26235 [Spirosoma sordidisoli]
MPQAANPIWFEVSGPGELVATDNGDPADLVSFASNERKAYNGLTLAISMSRPGALEPYLSARTARNAGSAENDSVASCPMRG